MKNTYYVQNTITDEERAFTTLKDAVEYAVSEKEEINLVHNGFTNGDYYKVGDTVETLLNRCKAFI